MRHLIIYIICLSALTSYGQVDSTTNIKLNQVEVIKSFEVILEEAQKVTIKSVLPPQKPYNPSYKYDITIVPVELKYPDPQIKPLAMNPEPPFKINKGYLDLGYGILNNPEAKAGYFTSKKDTYEVGIHIDFSALDNTKNNAYQKYSNLGLQLYGTKMIKENMQLYGNIDASTKNRYFYHTDIQVAENFTEADAKRRLNNLSITTGIKNAEKTKHNINYDVNINLSNLNISNSTGRENSVVLKGKSEKHFGKTTVLGIEADFGYVGLNADTTQSLTTSRVIPSFKTQFGNLIIRLGASYIYGGNNQSSLFPEAMLSYGIAGPNLQVFAGVSQGYFTNNLSNISHINPFIDVNLSKLRNTIFKDYFGGIKGQFSFLQYQIKGGYKDVSQQMFLLNKPTDVRYFDLLYDDMTMVYISGNVKFDITDNIQLGGWLTQNIYSLSTISNAWHMPNIQANAFAEIRLLDSKLSIKGELFFNDKVDFINKLGETIKSNVLFDLNTTIQYQISEKISAYASGINLFNNKYERWYGYPSVGINGLVGIKVVF